MDYQSHRNLSDVTLCETTIQSKLITDYAFCDRGLWLAVLLSLCWPSSLVILGEKEKGWLDLAEKKFLKVAQSTSLAVSPRQAVDVNAMQLLSPGARVRLYTLYAICI